MELSLMQLLKAFWGITRSESGIAIDLSDIQVINAPSPIERSVCGIVTLVRLSFRANALAPIDFICAGSTMLRNEQPLKQLSVMSVTPSGIVMFSTQVLFSKPPRTFRLGFSVTVAPDLWHDTRVS